MKKRFFAMMALAAALCACTKEQMIESETTQPVEPSTPLVFTATMEGAPESKATFDNTAKCASWEVGDQISINGFQYQANTAGTNTTFSMGADTPTSEIRPIYVSTTTPHSYKDSYPASSLVDDSGTTKEWCTHTDNKVDGVWNIVVSTGTSCTLKTIKLWNAQNTASFPNRSWKNINVYGSESADGPWGDPIKSFQDLDLAINNYGFAGELEINATAPYTFYRIDVVENKGDAYMQMADMKFVVTKEFYLTYVSSTNAHSYQDSNPASNLVDSEGTKTRWCAHKDHKVDGVWNIVVSTGKQTMLKTIKLWNAENKTFPGRRWKEIYLYGRASSSDAWRRIEASDDLSNLNLEANNFGLAGEIKINSSTPYTFYRIDVLENEGDNFMQMSDMKFTVEPTSPYNAYFPASLFNGEGTILPSSISETWAEGAFNMPMYAQSNTPELGFKNLCGVLKITVKKDQLATVKSIRVSSANKATSGEFTISNNTAVLTSPNEKTKTVTVTYTNAVQTTVEGTDFYVAIPAQVYQSLKVELSSDGVNYTKNMTTKKNTNITVERNKIYPITVTTPPSRGSAYANSLDRDVNWVQLWYEGPKFAEINIGATTSATDVGGYYGHSSSAPPTDLWGNAWRMPSKSELKGLMDNCSHKWYDDYNSTGVRGMEFTGKNEYAANSIFLPACGYYPSATHAHPEEGYYWASDKTVPATAPALHFGSGLLEIKAGHPISYKSSVRAVLKE